MSVKVHYSLFTLSARSKWKQQIHGNSRFIVNHGPFLQPMTSLFPEWPVLASEDPPGVHHSHLSLTTRSTVRLEKLPYTQFQRMLHLARNPKFQYHVHIGPPAILESNELIKRTSDTVSQHALFSNLLSHVAPRILFSPHILFSHTCNIYDCLLDL